MNAPAFERTPIFARRPALVILVALGLGIVFGQTVPRHAAYSFPLAAVLFCLSLLGAIIFRRRSVTLIAGALAACFCFGVLLILATHAREDRSVLARLGNVASEEVALVGTITDVRADGRYIRLDCERVLAPSGVVAVDEAAGIFLDGTRYFRRGDRIKAVGELVAFTGARNPYAFDYDTYLRTSENIDAMMHCNASYDIMRIGHNKPSLTDNVLEFFSELRAQTKALIVSVTADTLVRGFALAMLLGERHALPDNIWEDFQQAGLSHILVVSGFNLGIVAWIFYIMLRMVRAGRREVRIALVMAGTLFYGLLIGSQPSVIRAVIVVELILLSRLLERRSDLTNITAGAALINLVLDPQDLFNVGFQLSYAAVFSLTLIAPALDRFVFPKPEGEPKQKRPWHEQLLRGMIGTTAVLIGTFPIVLFHFHQVSVIAILTNLITIPLASVATIVTVLLIPLSVIGTGLAAIYADALTVIVHIMSAVAHFAAGVPFAVVRLPHPSLLFIILYVAGILYIIRPAHRRFAVARLASVAAILFVSISTGLGFASSILEKGEFSVVFFDVGQGDAALITTPGGKQYLVDCGDVMRTGRSVARRTIFPMLRAEHVGSLDAVFATHMHLDHFGGFVEFAAMHGLDTFYSCGGKSAVPQARSLDSIVKVKNIPVVDLERGQIIELDEGVSAYILNPPHRQKAMVANEHSLVMKIVYGNTSVLLLGDITKDVELELVERYGDFLRSDVVKAAHHGSRSSSCSELIAASSPTYAVFSAGRRNRHGHPHHEVVERWQKAGAILKRTDEEGALLFMSDGRKAEFASWK